MVELYTVVNFQFRLELENDGFYNFFASPFIALEKARTVWKLTRHARVPAGTLVEESRFSFCKTLKFKHYHNLKTYFSKFKQEGTFKVKSK